MVAGAVSLIATVSITHDDLALTPSIRAVPDVDVQVVPHSATDAETGLFFFLVEGPPAEFDGFEDALDRDGTVAEWTRVDDSGGSRIYRLRHTDGTKVVSPVVAQVGGLMVEAEAADGGWTVKLQLPDREALLDVSKHCREADIGFDLRQLYRQEGWPVGGSAALTERQRETLLTAYEAGYFAEPRETSLDELAADLDVSPSAVSGRLRRGIVSLIESTLVEE